MIQVILSKNSINLSSGDLRAFLGDYQLEIFSIIENSIVLKHKLNSEKKPDIPYG